MVLKIIMMKPFHTQNRKKKLIFHLKA